MTRQPLRDPQDRILRPHLPVQREQLPVLPEPLRLFRVLNLHCLSLLQLLLLFLSILLLICYYNSLPKAQVLILQAQVLVRQVQLDHQVLLPRFTSN